MWVDWLLRANCLAYHSIILQMKKPLILQRNQRLWSEWRDSLHSHSQGNENYGVVAVQPATSSCPPDSCIELFESRPIQSKNPGSAKAESGFLVRVARLELAASWSQTRRPTNWATPGFDISSIPTELLYTNPVKKQPLIQRMPTGRRKVWKDD